MDNGIDPMLRDQRADARLIAGVTNDERCALRYRPNKTGREIVEHDYALAGIDQREPCGFRYSRRRR
jgi:hypothetical protein